MNGHIVTVVMPVLNCEKTITTAVRSILNQSLGGWELLVIDDGSTDKTLIELGKFKDDRIKIICNHKNLGMPARLNQGIGLAGGKYYARMDGDDVSYPNRLKLQVEFLEAHPEIDLVGGELCVFGEGGRLLGKRNLPAGHEAICRRPYSGFPMAHPTFVGRRYWFQKWRFRLESKGTADQDLLLRAFAQSRFANIPKILVGYREERVLLRKMVSYRTAYWQSLVENRLRTHTGETLFGMALITGKLCLDTFAVLTGLQHRILRHRVASMSDDEKAQWRQTWKSVSEQH